MRTVLLIMTLSLQSRDTLYFEAPKDADPSLLSRAAKAMEARCAESGHRQVTSKVVDRNGKKQIELSCKTGISEKASEAIRAMAEIVPGKMELRFHRPLSEQEKEQFPPGGAAPKDHEWVKLSGKTWLLRKQPVIPLGGLKWARKDKDRAQHFFVFTDEVGKKLAKAQDEGILAAVLLLVDGEVVPTEGVIYPPRSNISAENPHKNKWRWENESAQDENFGIALNNPLPFKLTPAD